MQSNADLLVLLGNIPIAQYLKKVADVPYSTLGEYVDLYGYGNATEVVIKGKSIKFFRWHIPDRLVHWVPTASVGIWLIRNGKKRF